MSDNRKELGETFDTAASLYDKMRPGYVEEIYKTIFDYIQIDNSSRVVEVGSGSGQASLPVLKTGCEFTAVEYGEKLSQLLKDKFKEYERFNVVTGKFEDVLIDENSCDLVFSATAFHWIPEEIGYPKVYSILKSGGAFARFANRPHISQDNPDLASEIDEIYNGHYNKFYGVKSGSKKWFTEDNAREISLIPAKYGFTDIKYHLFYRTRKFTAKEYIALLGTYSDHIAIEESIRNVFFGKIEDAINRYGGTISINDTLDLELARKK